MTKSMIVLSAVLTLAAASLSLPVQAATAHNTETGANTSNAYDTAATAYAKQQK